MSTPLLSIAIPAYARPKELQRAIRSVLDQEVRDIELIVGDDSGDLEPVVRSFNDQRIIYVRNDNRLGMVGNWTAMLDRCTAPLIGLLMDDDALLPGFASAVLARFLAEPDLGVVFTDHVFTDQVRSWPRKCRLKGGRYDDFLLPLLRYRPVAVSAAVMRREVWDVAQPLPDLLTADLVMHLRMALAGYAFAYLDRPFMAYAVHQDQQSVASPRFRQDQVSAWEMFSFDDPRAERLRRRYLARARVSVAAAQLRQGHSQEARAVLSVAREQGLAAIGPGGLALGVIARHPVLAQRLLAGWGGVPVRGDERAAGDGVYLPQFHPIAENDQWWGPGFTEWTNVVKARPLFKGHYQPHLPSDLGFYDLRNPESREQQADLAATYGIHGFCYWHYWFNGRRILERPFTEVLSSGKPDFPFMLCWANENWTRTWDGGHDAKLLVQDYSAEDDRRHIRSLFPAFEDPRYVRIDGKPVFGIYRTGIVPDVTRTAQVWREEADRAGLGDLYLLRIDAHETLRPDPRSQGLDAAVEFQPDLHLGLKKQRPPLPVRAFNRYFRPHHNLRNHDFLSYEELVRAAVARREAPPQWLLYPGLTPMWDNSARRAISSKVYVGSTPELYAEWLESIVATFVPPTPDENLVFINAWNEWAEGNHLEPDARWGRAYLEATKAALSSAVGR